MHSSDDNTSYVDVTELFVTGEAPAGGSETTSTFEEIDSPIKDLKAVILSLDWEITDQTMQNFAEEIDRLEEDWAADKILTALLKILRELGRYIATKKARAHPDSVKLLYSVYNNLEKVVLSEDMPRSQKKEIVADELRKYIKLKKQFDIATSSAAKRRKIEESEIVSKDQEIFTPEMEVEPAVQPLPGQVPEPEAAMHAEAAIPEVEEDKMPAALVVEEMEEQMETEVVGLDMMPPATETSTPMEEMYEAQPSSPADELPAKMDLDLLDREGDKTAPPSQTKKIVPELSEEESFSEIDNRLEEFFDEEPAEAERAEEKKDVPLEMGAPTKEVLEEEVVPLEMGASAEEVLREAAAPPPLEVPEVELQVEDLLVDKVEVPAPSEAAEEMAALHALEDETELELMEKEETPATEVEQVSVPTTAPMESLKKFVLSINGDADQRTIKMFRQEIQTAKEVWQEEPELRMFLNILSSLVKNVALPVESAALDSVTMLRSVFTSMEVALSSHDETRTNIREILFREMAKYIQHQEQIVLSAISTPAGVRQILEEKPSPPRVPEHKLDEQAQASETEKSLRQKKIEEKRGKASIPKAQKAELGFLERLKNLFK